MITETGLSLDTIASIDAETALYRASKISAAIKKIKKAHGRTPIEQKRYDLRNDISLQYEVAKRRVSGELAKDIAAEYGWTGKSGPAHLKSILWKFIHDMSTAIERSTYADIPLTESVRRYEKHREFLESKIVAANGQSSFEIIRDVLDGISE